MRLHRLEVTAFGPFAEHQQVDFDRLSAAGLFLLHGPTGAGKTSVLDAICFALYGRVPGVRGNAARLRSDHAAAHVAPEVVCDFSVSGRRLEVTRSPEWQRPKKRGTGTVREQTHVVVRELVAGEWIGLTNRIDEAALLLEDLLGLGAEQFTKLILLPQGDFAAFLRASAEERRPLLQKLFGTDRFAEVERWLADRRREFEHHIHDADAVTARLYAHAEQARLAEPATEPAEPADPADPDPDAAAADDVDPPDPRVPEAETALALVTGWAEAARTQQALAQLDVTAAEHAHEQSRLAVEAAAERRRQQQRRAELSAELVMLRTGEAEQEQRRSAIAAASHAGLLSPLLTEVDDAERELAAARRRWTTAATGARAAGEDAGDTWSEALPDNEADAVRTRRVGELREELGALAGLLPAETDLQTLTAEHERTRRQLETAEQDRLTAEQDRAGLSARLGELTVARGNAELLAVTLPDREQSSARAIAVARAVVEQQQVELTRTQARDDLRAAVDLHQGTVEACQLLRARRLDGMAAELAAGLDPDAACPVCGSCEHPVPAEPTAEAVTEQAQHQAETAETAARAGRELAQDAVNAADQRWAALQAITEGAGAEVAATALREAEARLVEAREAGVRARRLAGEVRSVEDRLGRSEQAQQTATALTAAGRETLAERGGRIADLRHRLDQARGDDVDVRSRHDRLAAAATALQECLTAGGLLRQAAGRLERSRTAAHQAVEGAGFADRAAATSALLPEAARLRLRAQVEEHDAQVARLTALLAESRELAESTVADEHDGTDTSAEPEASRLDRLGTELSVAREAHQLARERHTLATRAVRALTGLVTDLNRHATTTAPLRRRFAALDSVSKCVEGTGGDNALRMRLSSYVLAARLEQVAEAASLRLAAMSGGRYLLVHTDGPSRGGARSGLGLAVIDGWTGVQRDPGSLSGGETFCTSLALALGLADVVQAEAGGSVIETLLVDEGFGSLDEQTLDEVMDVLDGLRSAGRSVGLVSHVADLRDRIPAQLRVRKTRTGSQLIA